ncbi:MAG: Cache 3/Cache 2 fusion domain-containing protein, partial [Spirochaetales bacterium]|nr:Cache 3/Cache 2 fusion domain-containing protein [Spirochaetales bacterium]
MNKKKRKSLAGRVIWLIVIPAVAIPMILVVYFLFYSFKDAISNTVYSDLESLVEINTAFAGKLLENNDNREDLLSELKPLYNSQIVIGETGFIFCVDLSGNLIVHKKVEGENWKDKGFISHIIDNKNGFHRYISPKTGTYKLASFRQLPGT